VDQYPSSSKYPLIYVLFIKVYLHTFLSPGRTQTTGIHRTGVENQVPLDFPKTSEVVKYSIQILIVDVVDSLCNI
jgi:hypothetical protein